MNPPENGFDSGPARPFLVHSLAQQPPPSARYQHPACNPPFLPGAGSRNGYLYFPCSVVPSEYPGFLVPQSPLPITLTYRPVFSICYNPAQFWHCNGCATKMKTKETQTELQQVEKMSKKQDLPPEGNSRNTGTVTSLSSTNSDTETDNSPEETDGVWSSVAQKRELHGHSSSDTLCGSAPQGSLASENKKRMDEDRRSLMTQFWTSFRETVRLYDLACGGATPENVQHHGTSPSSCGSRGVHADPQEGGDQRAVQPEQCRDGRRETFKSGSSMEMDKDKKGCVAVPRTLPPSDEVEDGAEIHHTLNSDLYPATGDVGVLHERPLCTSIEAVKDPLGIGESEPDPSRGDHGFPEKAEEEEVGEQNSFSPGPIPSAAWLAQLEKVDEATQCDMSWWQDAELERCPEASPEGSGMGTGGEARPLALS